MLITIHAPNSRARPPASVCVSEFFDFPRILLCVRLSLLVFFARRHFYSGNQFARSLLPFSISLSLANCVFVGRGRGVCVCVALNGRTSFCLISYSRRPSRRCPPHETPFIIGHWWSICASLWVNEMDARRVRSTPGPASAMPHRRKGDGETGESRKKIKSNRRDGCDVVLYSTN